MLGLEEISHELPNTVSHVVSLIDPGTILPCSIRVVSSERHLILQMHDAFESTNNLRAPTREDALALCEFTDKLNYDHLTHLLVHCHMGRSRSAAAALIILVRLGHCSPVEACQRLRRIRDPIWPNWTLISHGDDVLGCQGELLRACDDLYAQVRENYPKWVEDPRQENA